MTLRGGGHPTRGVTFTKPCTAASRAAASSSTLEGGACSPGNGVATRFPSSISQTPVIRPLWVRTGAIQPAVLLTRKRCLFASMSVLSPRARDELVERP